MIILFFFLSGYFFLLTFIYCSQSSGRCLSIKSFGSLDNFWRLDKDDKDHLKNPICAFVSSTGTGLSHIRTDEFEYTIDSILSIFSSRHVQGKCLNLELEPESINPFFSPF